MKKRHITFGFLAGILFLLIIAGFICGCFLYQNTERLLGVYPKGTEQCITAMKEVEGAIEATQKAESGKITINLIEAGRKIEGEVVFKDYHFSHGTQCFQYYLIQSGTQTYLMKNQGYYYGCYTLENDNWVEHDNTLSWIRTTPGWDMGYWTSYLLFNDIGATYYTEENLVEITVYKKSSNTVYLINYGSYGYRRLVVDSHGIILQAEFLNEDMDVTYQCVFEPGEIQQVITPYDENITELMKPKFDLDADGTLDDISVEYLKNGIAVTVNNQTLQLKYGEELPDYYYSVPIEDMKRFQEQDSATDKLIFTLQAGKELTDQVWNGEVSEYVSVVIGYDGDELYFDKILDG